MINGLKIGLCGAHGTGKSTILQEVKNLGGNVLQSQLSRDAQKALGWLTLKEAEKSEENMWLLQDMILQMMIERDQSITQTTLVDRTPADLWGYVLLWSNRVESVDLDRLTQYRLSCQELAKTYKRHLVVPIRDEIKFVSESNRADENSRIFHQEQVIKFIADFDLPSSKIQTLDPIYRAHEALIWL